MDQQVEGLSAYREELVGRTQKASESYDKAVMTLSGGALGTSITFLHNIAPRPQPSSVLWLWLSWSFLVASLATIFVSLLTSQFALRTAIDQVDKGTIRQSKPGGAFSTVTVGLNIASAALLVLGLVFLALFALVNFPN